MARHADPQDRSFRSSLLRAAAGGLVALLVTFAATWLLTVLGRDGGTGGPAMLASGPTEFVQAPTPQAPTPQAPSPQPSPEPETPAASVEPTPQETTQTAPGEVTVQVLDAVGSGTQAQAAADVLEELGYTVVVVNPTPRRVSKTTILATPGHEDAAEALRAADDRFRVIDQNNDFNPSVDLHVLVGPDFTP